MLSGLFCVFLTVIFTVYGQLIIKWQMSQGGQLPVGLLNKLIFLIQAVFNPWIISGLFAAFLAALAWMAAMTKLELSYAYPFMSASFVLVFLLSILFFHESFTWWKLAGLALIVLGLLVSARA
jgi:multidrug transporter EmrE-like cation transporter